MSSSTWEAEAGGPPIQGQPGPHSESKAIYPDPVSSVKKLKIKKSGITSSISHGGYTEWDSPGDCSPMLLGETALVPAAGLEGILLGEGKSSARQETKGLLGTAFPRNETFTDESHILQRTEQSLLRTWHCCAFSTAKYLVLKAHRQHLHSPSFAISNVPGQ
jgi:hypothetical protein